MKQDTIISLLKDIFNEVSLMKDTPNNPGLNIVGSVTFDDSVMQSGELDIIELLNFKSLISSIESPVSIISLNFMADLRGGKSALKTVSLPNITNIPEKAFYSCRKLISCNTPNVSALSNHAFYRCTALTTLNTSLISALGEYTFYLCVSLFSDGCVVNATNIPALCFYQCSSMPSFSGINVTTIGTYAFAWCTSLSSVTLPVLTAIPSNCFEGCCFVEIDNTVFPKVTTIQSGAFKNNKQLVKISMPNASGVLAERHYENTNLIEAILTSATSQSASGLMGGIRAFYNCTNLKYVDIESVKYVSTDMFYGCPNLIKLKIGSAFSNNQDFAAAGYNPVNAMEIGRTDLLEEGETFLDNNDKWNYYLREYIAKLLSTTTNKTLTFGESVLSAMTDETKEAFTSKGWTLA